MDGLFSHKEIGFGKYVNETWAFVAEVDPQYLLWLHKNGMEFSDEQIKQLEENKQALEKIWAENASNHRQRRRQYTNNESLIDPDQAWTMSDHSH